MELIEIGKLIKNLNPVNGCTIGCKYCYAKKINDRFHITPEWEKPKFIPERLKRMQTKKPNIYFLTSMSDFSDWQDAWREQVFAAIAQNPQHTYLVLTKRPEKLNFATDLPNVWFGVTVTADTEQHRIAALRRHIKAQHYFITFEPLFSALPDVDLTGIGWVVIGTETGSRKGKIAAEKEWVLPLAAAANAKNIPVFMKESLAPIVGEENMQQSLFEVQQ